MRRGERDKAKEWFLFVAINERDRSIRTDIDNVARRTNHAAIVFQRRIEVLAPMA